MNAIVTGRGRIAATVLACAALLFGATTTASAQGLGGLLGSPAATQTAPAAAGLPGLGLFKSLFAVFGAVRAQVPVIAAPIISQAVTDGAITQAEADQLTAWLAGHHSTGMSDSGSASPRAKPSAGEITVLHKVIAAVIGQLATIAAPVLAQEVTAGDITQAEADMITKILGKLAGAASTGTPSAGGATTATGLTGSAASGGLLSTLQSTVTAQVKKTTKRHKHRKVTHTTRVQRSH